MAAAAAVCFCTEVTQSPHNGKGGLFAIVNPNGTSFNFEGNDPKYAQYVLTRWPGLVTCVPDAIGNTVLFGSRLTTELNTTTNPLAYAAATSIGVGNIHQSWDCKLDDVSSFSN